MLGRWYRRYLNEQVIGYTAVRTTYETKRTNERMLIGRYDDDDEDYKTTVTTNINNNNYNYNYNYKIREQTTNPSTESGQDTIVKRMMMVIIMIMMTDD